MNNEHKPNQDKSNQDKHTHEDKNKKHTLDQKPEQTYSGDRSSSKHFQDSTRKYPDADTDKGRASKDETKDQDVFTKGQTGQHNQPTQRR